MKKFKEDTVIKIIKTLLFIGFLNLFIVGIIMFFSKNIIIHYVGFILGVLGFLLSGLSISIFLDNING